MKKTIFLASMALCVMFANAQTVQTKTVDLAEDVKVTYSYYLNETGNEVKHGKYTITQTSNYDYYKGKKTMTCSFKEGKMTGLLTYSSNISDYEKYVDFDKDWEYNQTQKKIEYATKFKKVREHKENFSVEMYEDYMTGAINLTFECWASPNRKLTIIGNATNGVLNEGTTFEMKEDGELVETYKNLLPKGENARFEEYKAGTKPNGYSDDFHYYEKGIILSFGTFETACSFELRYPRFINKPYLQLSGIKEWQNITSGSCKSLEDSLINVNDILYYYKGKKYDLSPEDVTYCQTLSDSLKSAIKIRDKKRQEYKDEYNKLSNKCQPRITQKTALLKSVKPFFYDKYCKSTMPIYNDPQKRGMQYIGATLLDENIERLVIDKYNNLREIWVAPMIEVLSNKPSCNIDALTPSDIQAYKDYTAILESDELKECELLSKRDFLNDMIWEMRYIDCKYVEQKTTGQVYKDRDYNMVTTITHENTTRTVKLKKNLYADYIAVATYLADRADETNSISEYWKFLNDFKKVCDKMLFAIDNKTKDLEKALKATTTPEEKLNIFLQQ